MLEQYRESVRKVIERSVIPKVEECEEEGKFDFQGLRALGAAGLAAPILPEPWGIESYHAQEVLAEEMTYACSGFALSVLCSTCLFGHSVARYGSAEQKAAFLPGIADGTKVGAWGLTEPASGSDALALKSVLKKTANGWSLHGAKTFITNAPIADFFVVFARLADDSGVPLPGFGSGVALLLERGMKGLSTGNAFKKLGNHSSPTGEIFFDGVEITEKNILGKLGEGFGYAKGALDVERVVMTGMCLGVIRFCLDKAARYSLERKQFGKPIADFQLVQDRIASMASRLALGESYIQTVLALLESGKEVTREAAILKVNASKWAVESAGDAVQILGGYGYMQEYQVERCLRDSKLYEIGGGATEIQKMIIAKSVLSALKSS